MSWTCPYCLHTQTVTSLKQWAGVSTVGVADTAHGTVRLLMSSTGCSNPECKQIELNLTVVGGHLNNTHFVKSKDVVRLRVLPPGGGAKPQPEYIPKQIRDDYREACLIRDLSAKASATLARRCLQGMIRDFGQVPASTLYKETLALAAAVEAGTAPRDISIDSIEALTAVRRVGNIGAHMEADVNLLVDVDPDEAQLLINVIELLLEEWYVERHKRQERFRAVIALDQEKTRLIEDGKAAKKVLEPPSKNADETAT